MLSCKASILVGVAIRAFLFVTPDMKKWLADRPEISTPQSSWMKLKEGIALQEHNISLYDGDSYHDTPLMLQMFLMAKQISLLLIPLIFVLADVLAALHLYMFSRIYVQDEYAAYHTVRQNFADDSSKILMKNEHRQHVPQIICMLYMLNPFIIATCVGKSTVVFNNLFLSLLFYHAVKANAVEAALFLALSTYQTLYPVQLLIPLIYCHKKNTSSSMRTSSMKLILAFIAWIGLLFGVSYLTYGDSLFATYKFILFVPDLKPNVGIFWYFFTEVFDHFHTFFLSVFQLNVLIFCLPLTIKLRSRPVFLMFLLCYIIATFKSYPCIGDTGFCLCLLPLWSYRYNYLRFPLITSVMLLVSTVLCPIMWHLWINAGTANANFYFATTLTYCTANVLIITDVLVSYLKYDFHLMKGLKPKVEGSNKVGVIRLLT